MIGDSDIDLARVNHSYRLERTLASLSQDPVERATAMFGAAFDYRVLGLCALLIDADVGAFRNLFAKSGMARLALLQLWRSGADLSPKLVRASKDRGFAAALAAGDLRDAQAIAELAPTEHFPDVEYEDDFLFYHFLNRAAIAESLEDAGLEEPIERWKEVLEGGGSGRLEACEGLLSGSEVAFRQGLIALLHERQDELDAYQERVDFDPTLFAAEAPISVEALAVVALAFRHGIEVSGDYPLLPSLALPTLGGEFPHPDSWRVFSG